MAGLVGGYVYAALGAVLLFRWTGVVCAVYTLIFSTFYWLKK